MAADLNRGPPPLSFPVIVAPEVFARTAADYIARTIHAASERGSPVSVALSGGRGPRPVYQELAATSDLPWGAVDLYFADERAVPSTDSQSNYRLVSEILGFRFASRPGAIHRMEADRTDLADAAEQYEAILPPRFDLLVLGMGEDGHTASLFPHHPANSEQHRRVLGVQGPASPSWRMTITPPVILAAWETLMLVAGEPKAPAVARALQGRYDPAACPAQWARRGRWILDQPAASQIRAATS